MVIDELIVVLGLDARKFTEGQRDALAAFRKTQEAADEFGKKVEERGAKMAEMFGLARKGALGLIGAFIGGEAASFIHHVIGMDAATGRMAKTIGTSVENLGIWQSMVRQVGGTAEEATGALAAMQNQLNNVRFGNGEVDPSFGFLLGKIPGGLQTNNADSLLRKMQQYFAGEIGAGRLTSDQAATQMSWLPGMNQSMINLLLDDFKKIEESAKQVGGANDESARGAQRLVAAFSLLTQQIERMSAALTPFLALLTKPAGQIGMGDINSAFKSDEPWFTPGGYMDQFWRWQYKKINGVDPPGAGGGAPTGGGRSSSDDRETWIKSLAAGLGIDPQVAMTVSRNEGFGSYKSQIPGEQSFGDFQLNMNKGNLGDKFQRETGLDPRDPANERAMDEYALKYASKHGWGAFHGARDHGIDDWQGIGARARAGNNRTSSVSTSTTHIGKVEVNMQATDAEGIARDIAPAIKYSMITNPAATGLA